jgi:replication-associated recombination protein RarA
MVARRVVIVDCADEMNPSAANALLKELEEPPKNTVMFLISHQPSGLLPTIRSRCRTLRLDPLSSDDLVAALDQAGLTLPGDASAEAIAALAEGSVGRSRATGRAGRRRALPRSRHLMSEPAGHGPHIRRSNSPMPRARAGQRRGST